MQIKLRDKESVLMTLLDGQYDPTVLMKLLEYYDDLINHYLQSQRQQLRIEAACFRAILQIIIRDIKGLQDIKLIAEWMDELVLDMAICAAVSMKSKAVAQ